MIASFKKYLEMLEATSATIYTQSNSKGATVNNSETNEPPVMINIDDIVNYEQASKMQQPKSQDNMASILNAIRSGQPLPPIMVRKVNNLRGVSNPRWDSKTMTSAGGVANSRYKYQVVDGHHRYWAYKAAGVKQIPTIIITPENIRWEKVYTPE